MSTYYECNKCGEPGDGPGFCECGGRFVKTTDYQDECCETEYEDDETRTD